MLRAGLGLLKPRLVSCYFGGDPSAVHVEEPSPRLGEGRLTIPMFALGVVKSLFTRR